jgi:hypothetical protein
MASELSGRIWIKRFPDAGTTEALADGFRQNCQAFIAALQAAGASVDVNATRRPSERAYLMNGAWRIHNRMINPQNLPGKAGVDIEWVHRTAAGQIDLAASRAAAAEMVAAYGLAFFPSLSSRHIDGQAVDMSISWKGVLVIQDAGGVTRSIKSAPRTGMNPDLWKVGKTFHIVKHKTDRPHWSIDGK